MKPRQRTASRERADVSGQLVRNQLLLRFEFIDARLHFLSVAIGARAKALGLARRLVVLVARDGVRGELDLDELDVAQPEELRAVLAEEKVGVEHRSSEWEDEQHDGGVDGHGGVRRGGAVDAKVGAEEAGPIANVLALEGGEDVLGDGRVDEREDEEAKVDEDVAEDDA